MTYNQWTWFLTNKRFVNNSKYMKLGGYIKSFQPGGQVSMMPDITMGQSSIQGPQTFTEKDILYKRNIDTAKEQERIQQLRQQQQGTLSQGNMKSDGLTPEQRNQMMYNPKGLGDVVKGAAMKNKIEYDNGNSVWNGLELIGKTALATGVGGAAIGAAGKVGQIINGANKAVKTADALTNVAEGYKSGNGAKMTSGALSLVSKAPVGNTVKNTAKAVNTVLKQTF